MSIETRIQQSRKEMRKHARFMRRVRQLYFAVIRKSIMSDPSNDTIIQCAMTMKKAGLYAKTAKLQNIRCSILCAMYRFDRRDGNTWVDSWHFWLDKNNWASRADLKSGQPTSEGWLRKRMEMSA